MLHSPRDFFKPKVVGAPEPLREIPVLPSRMIHFFDPSNPKMAVKVPDIAKTVDIMLGNLEDAVPIDRKEAAREGLVQIGKAVDFGDTQFCGFLYHPVHFLDARQGLRQHYLQR